MTSEKRNAKMTKQEAIHILMHIDTNVEYDEDFGIMVKAPLMDACVLAIKAIKADAVEVKHGRWEPRTDVVGFVRCSVCRDCNIYDDWADGKKWNYCPNCGAKMDLEGE